MPRSSFAALLSDDIGSYLSRRCQEGLERGERLSSGVCRDELARQLGISTKVLNRWCSGETMPTDEQFELLCEQIESHRAVSVLASRCRLRAVKAPASGHEEWLCRARGAAETMGETLAEGMVWGDDSLVSVAKALETTVLELIGGQPAKDLSCGQTDFVAKAVEAERAAQLAQENTIKVVRIPEDLRTDRRLPKAVSDLVDVLRGPDEKIAEWLLRVMEILGEEVRAQRPVRGTGSKRRRS